MNKYEQLFLTTTDTVTGLGAPVSNKNKDAIYDLKHRPTDKPLIIMIGNIEQARKFKEWNKKAEELAAKVWPGNTTLVLSDKLALRIPAVPQLCELISKLGPCYMTSANYSGEKSLSFEEAKEAFQEINTYYDFGKGSGKSSSIIDVNTGRVIR